MRRFILLLLILVSIDTPAQTGIIQGTVWDFDYDCPVAYAAIHLEHGKELIGTTADMNGDFQLYAAPVGRYEVTFSSLGYKTKKIPAVTVKANQFTSLDTVEMEISSTMIYCEFPGEYPVLIDTDDLTKMEMLSGTIKQTPMAKVPATYASYMVPIFNEGSNSLYIRGTRPESVTYFVDGVKVGNELSGVPPSSIGSYTLYTSGLPACYGDSLGGVILIETKSYFDLYNEHQRKVR